MILIRYCVFFFPVKSFENIRLKKCVTLLKSISLSLSLSLSTHTHSVMHRIVKLKLKIFILFKVLT